MSELIRYPRTRHLQGSFLPVGDDEADVVSFERFAGRPIVVSEKIDGANAAISFTEDGRMLLQSRNRFLEAQHLEAGPYEGLHEWAQGVEDELFRVLGTRYVMYGEFVRKKQCVFYDALPQPFLELDVYDTRAERFLSVATRRALLRTLPIASVPILAEGTFHTFAELAIFIGPSRFKTPAWRAKLLEAVHEAEVSDAARWVRETDPSDDMEGIYIKVEENGAVMDRAKFVRHGARQPYLHSNVSAVFDRRVQNKLLEQ